MHRIAAASLISAALGACGEAPTGEATTTKTTKLVVANPFHDRLRTLSERDRSLTLRRAVQDAGESCRTIAGSAYTGAYKGLQMWTASCGPNRDFAVYIAPSGGVQVRPCADARTLGLPECRPVQSADK